MKSILTILIARVLQGMGFLLLAFLLLQPCSCYVLSEDEWQSATATYSKEAEGGSLITGNVPPKPHYLLFQKNCVHDERSFCAQVLKEECVMAGGACGYGDLHKSSYGMYSAGLSTMLFNRGSTCGACFEVRCVNHIRWCLPGSPSVVLTATDFCPPNYGLSSDYGGWCNFPQKHFEMSETAFAEITVEKADFVPVQYRRVTCLRAGGLRFTVGGNAQFYQVLVTNVGSDGEVIAVKVKGSKTGWIPLARNWGQNWQCDADLKGQPLSFEVTTSDRRTLTSYNVVPGSWQYGQTFEGKQF